MTIETKRLPRYILRTVKLYSRKRSVRIVPRRQLEIGHSQWESGSRDYYTVLELATGRHENWNDARPWPESMQGAGKVTLQPGYVIIRHGTFMGKPSTPNIYTHPDDMAVIMDGRPTYTPELAAS